MISDHQILKENNNEAIVLVQEKATYSSPVSNKIAGACLYDDRRAARGIDLYYVVRKA